MPNANNTHGHSSRVKTIVFHCWSRHRSPQSIIIIPQILVFSLLFVVTSLAHISPCHAYMIAHTYYAVLNDAKVLHNMLKIHNFALRSYANNGDLQEIKYEFLSPPVTWISDS